MDKYLPILKQAIKNVISDYESPKTRGVIISGSGYGDLDKENSNVYHFSPVTVFETSFVEKLIINILKIYKEKSLDESIGWEISYPYALRGKRRSWNRSKLDIGMGYIKKSHNIFKLALEVKRWTPEQNVVQSKDDIYVPFNIWEDIFKLIGYACDVKDAGGHYDEVKEDLESVIFRKYLLLIFPVMKERGGDAGNYNENDIDDMINRTFLDFNNIDTWRKDEKEELSLHDFLFLYFLKKKLGWTQEAIEYVEDILHMPSILKPGHSIVETEPLSASSACYIAKESNCGACLLKIRDELVLLK